MSGVVWTASTWLVLVILWRWRDRRAGRQSDWLTRENIALLIALLGTKAVAAQSNVEEILRDPVVLERVIRGSLAALSVLIAGPILLTRLRYRRAPDTTHRNLMVFVVYLGVCGVSVVYSVAPLVTAAKVFELGAGLIAIGAAALAEDGGRRLRTMAKLVLALEGALVAVAVLGFFTLPGIFTRLEIRPGFVTAVTMTSPFAHANVLAAVAGIVGAYALAQSLESVTWRKTLSWLGVVALGGVAILLASGRQGVVMLVAAAVVLLWFRRRAIFMILIGPAVLVLTWINWDSLARVFSRGQPQLVPTLTGRLTWWEAALQAWAEHPWTGYGYGAGGRFVALASTGANRTSNVHNGYLETLVGVGLIGAIPLFIGLILVVAWSLGALRSGRDVPLAILIVPMILHTAVDQGFGAWLNADFILLVCLAGVGDWWRKERRRTESRAEHPLELVKG
jgi:O-antigen ligase